METWQQLRDTTSSYSNEALTIDALGDDMQTLFVFIVFIIANVFDIVLFSSSH